MERLVEVGYEVFGRWSYWRGFFCFFLVVDLLTLAVMTSRVVSAPEDFSDRANFTVPSS